MAGDETERRFRDFATAEVSELPVYVRIVEAAASDPGVMALMEEAPRGQRRPNLLLAAVHDLLLAGAGDELVRWFATANGGVAPPTADPGPAFLAFVDAHRDELVEALRTRATQTNEVNRSCLWWVATRAAAADLPDRPVALVELGASAGLNLGFDRAVYDWNGDGPTDGRLRCEVQGGRELIDAPLPAIVDRIGIDLAPIRFDDAAGVRWLKACIWPEQPERHRRFDAAVERARADPPRIIEGDLIEMLPGVVAALPADAHVIVVNSWVLAYVRRDRRDELGRIVGSLAVDRPITWVCAEGAGVADWIRPTRTPERATLVGLARWRDGRRADATVARCHAHLEWLDWFGA